MGSNTRVLSPTMVNESRFGYTQFYNTTGPELAFARDVVGELKIPGLDSGPAVQWGIPERGAFRAYTPASATTRKDRTRTTTQPLQFINNSPWIRGKHSFKFGGEVRHDHYNQIGNQFRARRSSPFSRNATNNLAITRAIGRSVRRLPARRDLPVGSRGSIANAQFRSTGFAFYFDDTWKVTSKITLNFGCATSSRRPGRTRPARCSTASSRSTPG